jgi:hypothetical protein
MLANIWSFLQDENTRAILAWIGGGVVVLLGGLWTVFKFIFSKRKGERAPAPSVTASHGGVAAGRDIRDNKIDALGDTKR